ncbi:MAG: CidA/LrgA family protein [Parvibaculum sp.]|nr:CidA/LrgA family protein [Parvibaculum sp.]
MGEARSMRLAGQLLLAFLILVACDTAGRLVSWGLGLPVPGTVIGILFLLGGLVALRRVPGHLGRVTDFLLAHLNFLYIPAGVGVMSYAALLADDLWPILVALFASTFLAMLAAGFAFMAVARLTEKRSGGE